MTITATAVFVLGLILMVVVPSVFGLWSIVAISIVASSALIFFGLTTESILGTVIASVFLEMFAGLPLGAYPISILIGAVVLILAGNVVRIEPLKSSLHIEPSQIASETLMAYVLAVVILFVSSAVTSLVYRYHWSLPATIREFATGRVLAETVFAILFTWLCWRGAQRLISLRHNKW